MHWIQSMVHWHPILSGALGMAIANAAITSMPSPDATSGKFYRWLFMFAHTAVLSISRIVAQYKDGTPPTQP